MSEPITLSELQMKSRILENELASLFQTKKIVQSNLKKFEARITEQLKAEIQTKKSSLNGLNLGKENWRKN